MSGFPQPDDERLVSCLDGPPWEPGPGQPSSRTETSAPERPGSRTRIRTRHCLLEEETRPRVAKSMRYAYRQMREQGVRRSAARVIAGGIAYVAGMAAHEGRIAEIDRRHAVRVAEILGRTEDETHV